MTNLLEHQIRQLFKISPTQDIQAITSLFKTENIKKGDFFLQKEKVANKLAFLQDGYIRIFVETPYREITQWVSTPGYFITDLPAFMYNKPSRWNMQALVDCQLLVITKQDYLQIHNILPDWNEVEKHFIIHCFTTLEERIYSHIAMSAEERYQLFFQNNKDLFNQIPPQYIASMLGMTPETLSRIRKKLL